MNKRWAVFLSGRGSTAQALFDLQDLLDIRLVISNRSKAYGLKRAARLGIPTRVLRPTEKTPEAEAKLWFDIDRELKARRITHIFLLGFMKLIPASFLEEWKGRVWNVHPSLLPLYPGLEAMEKSFEERALMGVTIHDVIAEMDAGTRRLQKLVYSSKDDRPADFSSAQIRMAIQEQRLIREWAVRMESGVSL